MAQVQEKPEAKKAWHWKAGIIGSLAGGLVFGMMMAMMGMLPMIAGIVHSQSAGIGFLVHMMISFIFGIVFTVFTGIVKWNGIISGVVYGIVLWLLFPFILMPMMMRTPNMAFHFTTASMMSLVGHMIYGLVTGVVYKSMTK
ncbi:hypothetical protein PP175_16205 [Aneurinibacillus sp. Ricciae_BoGa-3]|uniref:DUF6789 family protein n=1 Tax=Aneurinibacillus sp. Ricciae_BoGa-3 TaxID=3022697 RepID=UPI002340ABFA|nr:DUF6789 family protein [Aneurinibacillus sp. Ricciae_BoGa-3]WCK52958.1 hypothetical protein PP175_16205 [Aneurinibacillus sp. Ricciae_BoGa-3]